MVLLHFVCHPASIRRRTVKNAGLANRRSADDYSRAVDDPRYYGTSAAAELELYRIQQRALKDAANAKQILANYQRGYITVKSNFYDSDFKNKWDKAVTKHKNSGYLPDLIKNNLLYSYDF